MAQLHTHTYISMINIWCLQLKLKQNDWNKSSFLFSRICILIIRSLYYELFFIDDTATNTNHYIKWFTEQAKYRKKQYSLFTVLHYKKNISYVFGCCWIDCVQVIFIQLIHDFYKQKWISLKYLFYVKVKWFKIQFTCE